MPTCPSCGAPMDATARFCPQCGAQVPADVDEAGAAAPPPATRAGSATSQRNWAVFGHLSALAPLLLSLPLTFLGPLVMWLISNDRGEFARDQAAEALNFNLSWLLWSLGLLIVGAAVAIPTAGIALIPVAILAAALGIAWLVLVIVAAVRTSAGERYRYPVTIRFVSTGR